MASTWKQNKVWGLYRVFPPLWEVKYPPFNVVSKKTERVYPTSGVARFSTREEARTFVRNLQQKGILSKRGTDNYLIYLFRQQGGQ